MINEEIEFVEQRRMTKEEIGAELEKAKIINDNLDVRQAWDDLVKWMIEKTTLTEAEVNIFISDSFTFEDFKTEIRLAID